MNYLFCLSALFLCSTTSTTTNAETCRTPNGETAECVPLHSCAVLHDALYDLVKVSDPSTVDFLRESQCGGSGQDDPKVCCGTTAAFQTLRTEAPRRPQSVDVSLSSRFGDVGSPIAGRDVCGYMVAQDRILSGIITGIDEFPWMALLEYVKKSDGTRTFYCGGSLIGKRYILTAAHCVSGKTMNTHRLINVRLGEWNIETEEDCINKKSFKECTDPPVNVGIEKVIVHPNYNDSVKSNDIALIRLNSDVHFSDFVRPICLPSDDDYARVGEKLFVAGWGRTETAKSSAVKLKVQVPVTSRIYCRNKFRQANIPIRDGQICAGGEKGRDSCTGDSGGPLMKGNPETEQWFVAGIVSFGTTCGTESWPAVYTHVSVYNDWIHRNVY
ncbi:PREDICTED: serine protease easter-like [Nicrophorus vespilloides]|uniref:CLIP domain-containing serine protease n=1 Tax=Nicrophorus vespilloides TaxID=110193 RepID=A0ABM1LZZ3_NICVS|nr:PREDICTED: serine protease easter-like [Nicrophorus vespilloides]